MKLIILGSGTSHGVPMLGCDCPVCHSTDPRDQRLRASLFIQGDRGEQVVIDTGPEFRLQAIRAGIKRLDALFLTHPHADHLHGLDDIRPLSREAPLQIYGNQQTLAEMAERFSYVFKDTQRGGGKPRLQPQEATGPVSIGNLSLSPLPVKHGALDILGWRIAETPEPGKQGGRQGASALYLTDTSAIPDATWRLIRAWPAPEVLIIGGLRTRPHETHFTFEQALDTAMTIGAKQTYLTHICHDYSHQAIEEYCQNYREKNNNTGPTMGPAYDGLELTI
ncbi:MAG: MBL fold metallo-hydrolase [Treponema sp.]|jgi:phosphoribosyl 1,2-cyclic phosphate phosphodiesterase|nr:MBL fold metallo-hydrolase [Treponema sp.]